MTFEPKNSSHIERVDHENGVMSIKFKNSAKPYKFQAPEEAFHGMRLAKSPGKFFHAAKNGWKPL